MIYKEDYPALEAQYLDPGSLMYQKVRLVDRYIRKADNLLDVGMGTGELIELEKHKFKRIWGIDTDTESIEICRRRFSTNREIALIECSLARLESPFESVKFDCITCLDVLEHMSLADCQRTLRIIENLLSADGKFIFTGTVPYEKVPQYINSSDICVVPKKPIKCSPLKLYEYMACGKPVIASDIEGVREILVESKSGICVPPESPHELAQATIGLLRDTKARESMGKNGRRHIVENRSWESVARKVFEVCQMVVQNTKRKAARGNSSKYKDSWTT